MILDAYGKPTSQTISASLMMSLEWMRRQALDDMLTRAAEARVRYLRASLEHLTMGEPAMGQTVMVTPPKRYDV